MPDSLGCFAMKWLDILWRLGEGAVSNVTQQLDRWRWQLLQSLLLGVMAAVCGLAVLMLTALLALMTFWESHRYETLWFLLLAYTGMTWWLVRRVGQLVRPPRAWSRSRAASDSGCCRCDRRTGGDCRAGS